MNIPAGHRAGHLTMEIMMNEKEVLASIEKVIAEPLNRVNVPLTTLALLQLANEFYTKEERTNLYAVYQQLCKEDDRCYEELRAAQASIADVEGGFEARVDKFGKDEATKQIAPAVTAMELRRESSAKREAFKSQHPILYKLIMAKTTLSDRQGL